MDYRGKSTFTHSNLNTEHYACCLTEALPDETHSGRSKYAILTTAVPAVFLHTGSHGHGRSGCALTARGHCPPTTLQVADPYTYPTEPHGGPT